MAYLEDRTEEQPFLHSPPAHSTHSSFMSSARECGILFIFNHILKGAEAEFFSVGAEIRSRISSVRTKYRFLDVIAIKIHS